ncbi:MAG TPA: SDR family NAD(P)-dependent oxidoreductase [Candidatus Limnocylindria bacterium]|nr:SDR family NAD(P)-dependent oxidoreductase [Candidatus Limnocylindria bacterium]
MKLEGKTIAITGGASGIGLATAQRVVADGGNAVVIDLNAGAVRDAAQLLGNAHALGMAADVTDAAAIGHALDAAASHFGRLDGLVTSAGIRQASARVTDLSAEVWERILRVDLGGTFLTCQAAGRIFAKSGGSGSIVNVASLSGHSPRVGQAAYCAAKAGVIALTKVLSLELASQHVRVNCVCPGTTITPFNSEALKREGEQGIQARIEGDTKQYRPGIPLRQLAEASDIASSIAFLLSDDARHITGVELFVDGGESVF